MNLKKYIKERLDTWVPIGTHNEQARGRWVERVLTALPAGARILDAGAGEQQFKRFCTHLDYVAQDLAEYDGKGNGSGLQMGRWDTSAADIVCDISAIPEKDASFDAILCTEVLEHVPEPSAVLKEFARLLRSGGHLILTAPFCSLTHFAPSHFCTGFNRYYFEFHLPRFGFEIREIETNGNFFEYLAQEIRRIPWITERYTASKPGIAARIISYAALLMLKRLNRNDGGSAEVLNFGMHVHAVKRAQP